MFLSQSNDDLWKADTGNTLNTTPAYVSWMAAYFSTATYEKGNCVCFTFYVKSQYACVYPCDVFLIALPESINLQKEKNNVVSYFRLVPRML